MTIIYQHADAYLLLTYETQSGESEVVWNSRDGDALESIMSQSGAEAERVRSGQAAFRAPLHTPSVGDRVFVDMTEVRARVVLADVVHDLERATDPAQREMFAVLQRRFASLSAALDDMAPKYARAAPADILVVTAGWLEQLAASRVDSAAAQDMATGGWSPFDPAAGASVQSLEPAERSLYYDRATQPISMLRFGELAKQDGYRQVARDFVERRYLVSTVWLGIDHSYRGGPPVIFETMVFDARGGDTPIGDELPEYTDCYSTEAEALAGHQRVLAAVAARRLPRRGNA